MSTDRSFLLPEYTGSVTATTDEQPHRRSEPRDRLLRTATEIFYARGIHGVGVDEIVSTAGITRSTLYRHFAGKEELVVAYLRSASELERAHLESRRTAGTSPEDAIRAVAQGIVDQIYHPAFRGCAFLNAAAEYPEPDHPVHRAILEHRRWFADLAQTLFRDLAGEGAEERGELFVLLRDGAMTAGCLGDRDRVTRSFLAGVQRLVP